MFAANKRTLTPRHQHHLQYVPKCQQIMRSNAYQLLGHVMFFLLDSKKESFAQELFLLLESA